MSLRYSPNKCENCDKQQSGEPSGAQLIILFLLTICFVIPGVIYYFCAVPSRCRMCGLKKAHRKG